MCSFRAVIYWQRKKKKKAHIYLRGLAKVSMQALSSSKRKHQKVLDQLISDGPNGHTAPTRSPTSFNLLKAETNSAPHVQYFRITFHTFISAPCY